MKKKGKDLDLFNKRLPFPVRDKERLKNIFVHRSFLNEPEGARLASNERLEFLGDSILSAAISRIFFDRFPELNEGELTQLRARLVNKRTLAGLARGIDMNEFMLLGRGEEAAGGAQNPSILSGAFEALIAAVYIDSGYEKVFSYIEGVFSPLMEGALFEPGHFDFKPALQELTQRVFKSAPVYRVKKETGPPHKKIFEVEAIVGGDVLGIGAAASKKDAEQQAAEEALKKLKSMYGER